MDKKTKSLFLKKRWQLFESLNPQLSNQIVGYLIDAACHIMEDGQVSQWYEQPNTFTQSRQEGTKEERQKRIDLLAQEMIEYQKNNPQGER